MTYYKRLPLSGLHNARDLGGWSAGTGLVTRCGVFLRSARPAGLSAQELDFLRRYGLTEVLDLRNADEIAARPSGLEAAPFLRYASFPLFNPAEMDLRLTPDGGMGFGVLSWGAMSVNMLRLHPAWVRAVFTRLAEASGCALFHCATGKDRTGIIAALLLRVCGVSREDTAADYCVSQLYLAEEMAEQSAQLGGKTPLYADTAGANMLEFLDGIAGQWGSEENYLLESGVTPEQLAAIRAKFVEEEAV